MRAEDGAGPLWVDCTRPPTQRRIVMPTPMTMPEREKELQALLATPEGRAELRALAERYEAAGGRTLHASKSLVTYVLIHELHRGVISS